jgi:hypothetical protein
MGLVNVSIVMCVRQIAFKTIMISGYYVSGTKIAQAVFTERFNRVA